MIHVIKNRIICLVVLRFTTQSTIFQSYRYRATAFWVLPVLQGVNCLAQGHNTVEVGL